MQKLTLKYIIHSLVVESSFELPPLTPIEQPDLSTLKPDITIIQRSPKDLSDEYHASKKHSSKECWVDLPEIAKFHIHHGDLIEVAPYSSTPQQSVLLYLFGSIMAMCLYQRGLLVLHANAIEVGNKAILFAGDSGVGKSTTAAIFHQKGFNVLSDDIVVLNQNVKVMGGFPQIKLFQNTLNELNISSENLTPISAQKSKFSFPLNSENNQKIRTINAMYILSTTKNNTDREFHFSAIHGVQRFKKLIENTYRSELIDGLNIKDQHLNLCASLSNDIHMMNIIRPSSYFSGYELVDKILEDLEINTSTFIKA